MANLEKVIRINETDYGTLVGGDTITKDGVEYEYDDSALYVIENPSPPAYALTAGQANTAVKDVLGRDIVDTYIAELVIDAEDGDTDVAPGTYSSITAALNEGKRVLLKVSLTNTSNGETAYLPLTLDYASANNEYVFGGVAGYSITRVSIWDDNSTTYERRPVPLFYTGTPQMDGTASAGSSSDYARGNHRHPTDTSRQATLVSGTNIKTINGTSILGSGNLAIVHPNTFTNSEIDLVFKGYTIAPGGGSND